MRTGKTRVLMMVFGTILLALPFLSAEATCLGDCDNARYRCEQTANRSFDQCLSSGTDSWICQANLDYAILGCSQQNEICILSCGGSSGGGPSNGAPPGNHGCFIGCRTDYITCLVSGTPEAECQAIQTTCFQYCGG